MLLENLNEGQEPIPRVMDVVVSLLAFSGDEHAEDAEPSFTASKNVSMFPLALQAFWISSKERIAFVQTFTLGRSRLSCLMIFPASVILLNESL